MTIKLLLMVVAFSAFSSCKDTPFDGNASKKSKIITMGHAGMGVVSLYPANTMESILKCLKTGANGVEIDIQMTKDSILVLFHNEHINSNDKQKRINSLTWSELQMLHHKNVLYFKYDIISLNDLFSNIQNIDDFYFSLDCKLHSSVEKQDDFNKIFSKKLVEIVDYYDLDDNIFIESGDTDFLTLLRKERPGYKLFSYLTPFEKNLKTALDMGLSGIVISTENITKEQVMLAQDYGLMVSIFGSNSRIRNVEIIQKNPDIIQTDKINSLVELVKEDDELFDLKISHYVHPLLILILL
jgi:glycerophosphoryl diester phosphodiesterase